MRFASASSSFFVGVETPPGTSPEGTLELMKKNEEWVFSQPEVAGGATCAEGAFA